jgi:tetratricopeptide (TPR) repeat protein
MLEAARKYAQKGAKDRALKEYEALLKLDPRDAKLRLEVADAHRRWGQIEEAAAAYRRVAEQYTAEGFDARAVAVYKQIQSLDPTGYAACEPLAELYQRMGLASEAISALQAAADGHARDGKKRHALDLLRRMVALDPANTTSRIKVADLLRQEKLLDEAAAEYDAACTELERQGETEAAGRVIERLLELAPDRVDVLARLARNLLARGRANQAEAPARRAAERQPQEIAHHELLAEVWRAQKRDDRLVEAYRRIAELYRLRGDEEQARDIMQRFVPMAAFEAPARGAGTVEESPFGSESLELDEPDPDRGPGSEEDFLDDPAPVTRPAASSPARPAAPRAQDAVRGPRAEPSRRAPAASTAEETAFELGAEEGSRILGDAEQLLAEASVYLRYGKRVQAIENLQAILARDPRHRAALERLGDAYADDGDTAGAVAAWLRAGELARDDGDLEAMGVLRDRVAALDAAAAATLEPDELPGGDTDEELLDLSDVGDADGAGEQDPAAPDGADEEIGEEFGLVGDEIGGQVREEIGEEIEIDVDLDAGEAAEPASAGVSPAASDPERVVEDLEEAEFYLQQGLAVEARALYERVLANSPGHPLALVRLGELAAAAGEDPDAPGAEAPGDRSATPLVAGAPRPLADETDPDGAWIAGDDDPFLEEPDAGEPAPDPGPDPFLAPDDEDADEPSELGGGVAAAEASVAPAPGPAEPAATADAFDLAAELSAALDETAPDDATRGAAGDEGFRAVFGAFKRGVQAALGQGDHEAHYDLGIAYREMGLLDDAIGEFRSAMASPARRIDCLHMLGLCALEQGRSEEAVDCLAHALAAPGIAQEQELAIRFELGRAYQQCGDTEKARVAWEKVASMDPEFCEVSELLATLAERRAPADAPAAEFESFDDLLDDVDEPPQPKALPEPEAPAEREPFDEGSAPVRADAKPKAKPRRRKISFV